MVTKTRASRTFSSVPPVAQSAEPARAAIGALLYLRLTSLQGKLRARVRRLKQPKYLLSAVVGAAYFYFAIGRRLQANHAPGAAFPADLLPIIASFGALLFLVGVVLSWILPRT